MQYPPEAPWVTEMRNHFQRTGRYRTEDLERLLGSPGASATLDSRGQLIFKAGR
jgi:hypothetical protein